MLSKGIFINQCGWRDCLPNGGWGPAVRDHYLLHFVASGEGDFWVGDHHYHLHVGQGFFIPPNVICTYKADLNNPWQYYWIGFNGPEAALLLTSRGLSEVTPVFSCHMTEQITDCLRSMMNHFQVRPGSSLSNIGYLYLFLSLIPYTPPTVGLENPYITQALEYIRLNYSYDLSVMSIARHLNLNRSYFYKIFLKETGQSPQAFLRDYRLDSARQLLWQGGISVTEAAISCGFKDITHFSAAYHKKFHVKPSLDKRSRS